MKTTRTLAVVAILGIAFSFRASAQVAYDSETTNEWFKVNAAESGDFSADPWTKPTDGEVSVVNSKIALDTDLDDPLIYTPTAGATGPVVTVTAEYTATANATAPDLTDTPQAALAVVASGADTNWYGLVKKDASADWEKFTNVIPTVGETYTIHIDLNNVTHKIRYWVGDTILGTGWYDNPKSATQVTSVSFVGTGDIGNFSGDVITENGATFNGTGYATFADALAAAKASAGAWSDSNPIVLYKDAAYEASVTENLYVNSNGKTFTINGSVVTKKSGNTYTVTAQTDCEAYIGSTYYVTFDEAVAAAGASDVIVVNKTLEKNLTVAKSYGLNPNGNLTCAVLTVNADQTLKLAGGLAVTTAMINGAVAGETLTVSGTLTGVNVAKLTFGDAAIFAFTGAKLAPTTLTMGTSLTITGLNTAEIGTEVITATGLDASKISATLPEGRCLEVKNNTLTVVKEIFATITAASETEGFDYTNGTVSVTANVKDGKTATAVLTVIGWDGSTKKVVEAKPMTSGTALTWDVAAAMEGALTQGGAYTYTVEVMVDDKVAAVKSGEFTAAKWGADGAWFFADPSTDTVGGGAWVEKPVIGDDHKYEVSDSRFNVTSEAGSNKFTRVDTTVAFESLVDGELDAPEGEAAIGGFVATTTGWMALNANEWVLLKGAPGPVVGNEYVIRTEFDFAAETKRMRFFVAEVVGTNVGDFFPLAVDGGSQWLTTGVDNLETLKAVEFQGSGKLASIAAMVADKALAIVDGEEYDDMDKALAEAKLKGKAITLLTNATIEPDLNTPGKYVIVPDGHDYMSGGNVSHENKTIIVEGTGKPPVVRLNDSEMKEVKLPGVTGSVQNTDKLRKFLEDSKIDAYTGDDASADGITQEMLTSDTANGLKYWQDYALGIVVGTSVAPVTTPAGDTNPDAITLAIPTIDKDNYSGDYDIRYQVMKDSAPVPSGGGLDENPGAILIPLTSGTGTYSIKAVFTPKTVPEQTVSGN